MNNKSYAFFFFRCSYKHTPTSVTHALRLMMHVEKMKCTQYSGVQFTPVREYKKEAPKNFKRENQTNPLKIFAFGRLSKQEHFTICFFSFESLSISLSLMLSLSLSGPSQNVIPNKFVFSFFCSLLSPRCVSNSMTLQRVLLCPSRADWTNPQNEKL